MVYDHMVKKGGKYYAAGENVPDGQEVKRQEGQQINEALPSPEKQPRYTKTDINRMSTAELQSLAASEGIDNAFNISGEKLKKILLERFGL